MNFFEHQDKAKRQSRWLIIAFIVAAVAIIALVDLVVMFTLGLNNLPEGATLFSAQALDRNAGLLFGSSAGTLGVISLASLFKVATLRAGGGKVARDFGGTLVDSDTRDPLRRRLRNVVEEIAVAAGVPVPEIYVLEQEQSINAFAAGYTPSDAAIAVTRGTLEKLNRSELQGVIAHEFSHIFNGDMRLNIRMMGVLFGVLIIALAGRRVLHSARYVGRSRDNNGGGIIVIALALMMIGYVGLFFGRWIKAAVSRQREYLADASAVQFTRDPDGIAGALKKIAAYSHGSFLEADSEEISHMLFEEGRRAQLFATHPPLMDRIKRINPHFNPEEIEDVAARLQRRERRMAEQEAEAELKASQQTKAGFDVEGLINDIGNPQLYQIIAAGLLAASFSKEIEAAAHSTEWAPEVLFYALLDADPELRERQLLIVAQQMGADSEAQVRRLLATAPELKPEQRLPLLEIAYPALKRRPRTYIESMLATVNELVMVDGSIDVFEYLLAKVISQHLWESLNPAAVQTAGKLEIKHCSQEIATVFSVVAKHGHSSLALQAQAHRRGVEHISGVEIAEYAAVTDWVQGLDKALPRLDQLKGEAKEAFVSALAEVVLYDEKVEVQELELFRAICAVIHTPLPVIVNSGQRSDKGA